MSFGSFMQSAYCRSLPVVDIHIFQFWDILSLLFWQNGIFTVYPLPFVYNHINFYAPDKPE